MYYSLIKHFDIANGIGVRVSLFVSGCRNHCKGCFQSETWNFLYGQPFGKDAEEEILKALAPDYISGLTILGGEPFEPENQASLLPFVRKVKELFPQKTIWAFSGYRLDDEILKPGVHPNTEVSRELISYIDVLVDGRFVEEKKNLSLIFRGSENQRIIDIRKSIDGNKIVLWDESHAKD